MMEVHHLCSRASTMAWTCLAVLFAVSEVSAGPFGIPGAAASVMPPVEIASRTGFSRLNALQISSREANMLAALAILEEPAGCPRLDVVQVVLNRVASPRWPSDIERVAFQGGQFQPFFGVAPSQVDTEAEAARLVSRKRKETYSRALGAIRDVKAAMGDARQMADSRDFVGGRTSFKGVSQYRHMWNEDVRRRYGCNFYHREKSQSWKELENNRARTPGVVAVGR
jgi:hypothetical protein